MQSTRFTVLTGHLSQYPLPDLIGILRHQRKTGRLLIEYVSNPATLFFQDGNLVDAQYSTLMGAQAVCVAVVQPEAAFNFNPLIRPTCHSISPEQQRFILEMLGCWTEETIIETAKARKDIPQLEKPVLELSGEEPLDIPSPMHNQAMLIQARKVLALSPAPMEKRMFFRSLRQPWVFPTISLSLLFLLGVPTLITLNKPKTANPTQYIIQSAATPPVNQTTVAADIVEPPQTTSKDETRVRSALDRRREGNQNNVRHMDRELMSDEVRNDTAQGEGAESAGPPPPKTSIQSEVKTNETAQAPDTRQTSVDGKTIKVILRIEGGRVTQASVGSSRPGMEAYESLALRIARQRRYPVGVNKQEIILIKVDGPK